jgi:hypothetical protein
MSGPFINYAILDEENDECCFGGFCYSPSKKENGFNASIGIHHKISYRA